MTRSQLQSKSLLLLGALLALLSGAARADDQERKLVVVTTLPYLADVARAVGGDQVTVEALAPPGMDPHFIQATPARSLVLSKADVLLENGVQLEQWSERVIDGARNQRIRPGNPGHAYCANGIKPLQVPRQQTRAAGEVHAGGNPHVWLDPLNLKRVAKNVEECLAKVRPAATELFAKNRAAFEAELDERFYGEELLKLLGARRLNLLQKRGRLRAFLQEQQFQGKPLSERAGGWLKRALALRDLKLISYHQVWIYFQNGFDIEVVATLEEKPGIPPSPAHLAQLEAAAKARGVKAIVCAPFYPFSRAEGLAERVAAQPVVLPTQPGEEGTKDIFDLFDTIFTRLEQAVAKAKK
ncbi:MAG: metal ABC transporter substrate-binding protein [Planctomycetota bacterium]